MPASPFAFKSVARTHVGKVRTLNEDRWLDRPADGLWAVADGMGGLSAGDLAAERLIAALARVPAGASGYARLADLLQEVRSINAALYSGAPGGPPPGGMGATFVALLVHDGHYACVWAGDSRAYLLRRGVLSQISHDHSVVQDLIDAGVLDEAGRRRHPSAHVVTRAVGAGETLLLEQRFARVLPEDIYLLCSDGLTGCLDDREIAEILQGGPLEASIDQLVRTALQRGAPDNVTVLGITASAAWR